MGFSKFRLNLIIRVVLLIASLSSLVYLAIIEKEYIKSVYIFVVVLIQVIEFLRYVDRTNRDLNNLFQSILQGDYQTSFNTGKRSKSHNELYKTITLINQKFQKISTAKEVQYQFLETLIAHLQVALVSFDENEDIQLINQSAKKLFNRPFINNLGALEQIHPEIISACRNIKPNQTQLIKTVINDEMMNLTIRCSEFKLEDKSYKLVTLQNIKNEMEAQEVDSWQKLIRVLTHEIMNSVAPITSLSDTLHGIVNQQELTDKNSIWLQNLATGLDAIKTRSLSLHSFTQAYQSLTHVPIPSFGKVNLLALFEETRLLFSQIIKKNDIKFIIECEPGLAFILDKTMISQVLINLIKNSIEAPKGRDQKAITLRGSIEDGFLQIAVRDNGLGISPEHLENIFVPFFTTKENGSGIGLAVSRQILHLHKGQLLIKSRPEDGTEALLKM